MKDKYTMHWYISMIKFLIALVLNLLKNFFERSRISFNRFRTSAKKIKKLSGYFNDLCYNCFIVMFFLFIFFPLYPFAYDRAALLAQRGQWKDAHEKFNSILVDMPDRADLLYDAGVTAYNLKNFSQAAAYFSRAAECADDTILQAQSHFNAGNALVADKLFSDALDQYQKTLSVDPAHEYARHNYERVKKMIEDQEKEQQKQQQEKNKDKQQQDKNDRQQQNNQDKDQQDNHDKEQKDDRNEQEQNGQDKQQQKDQNQEQSDNQKSAEGKKNQQQSQKNSPRGEQRDELDKESKGEQADDAQHGGKDTERKEHRDKDKHQKESGNNHEWNRDQKSQEETQETHNKNDAKHGNKHKETPSPESHGTDNNSVASKMDQEQGNSAGNGVAAHTEKENAWAQENPWLVDILNNQEERDKVINKKLMEAKIHQHGGKHGQNCW